MEFVKTKDTLNIRIRDRIRPGERLFGNIDVDSIYKYLDILNIPNTVLLETGKFV